MLSRLSGQHLELVPFVRLYRLGHSIRQMVAGAFDSEGGVWDNSEGIDFVKMGNINENTSCIHLQAEIYAKLY